MLTEDSTDSMMESRLTRLVVGIVVVAAVAFLTAWGIMIATEEHLPPCATEDSVGCYWDASERGNGLGQDFISPKEDR